MLDGFRHEALPYDGRGGFTVACRDIVRDGLDRDDRLIVLAESSKLVAVNDALGSDAADVTFVALDEHGRNPTRITTMLNTFQAGSDGRHCVGVAESVLASRSPASLLEAQLSEFLLNEDTVAGWPLTLICLYDLDTLSTDELEVMRQSHAVVRGQDANHAYLPGHAATMLAEPLDAPPANAATLEAGGADLGRVREFARANAVRAALEADRVDDLVLAVNEIATNSVRHGGGRARIAMWPGPDGAVCDVRDDGQLADPFVGRFAPTPMSSSGRGLWLANHLCDLVQIRSGAAGTIVRLYVDRRREPDGR